MNQHITVVSTFEITETTPDMVAPFVEKIEQELRLQFGTTYKGSFSSSTSVQR